MRTDNGPVRRTLGSAAGWVLRTFGDGLVDSSQALLAPAQTAAAEDQGSEGSVEAGGSPEPVGSRPHRQDVLQYVNAAAGPFGEAIDR